MNTSTESDIVYGIDDQPPMGETIALGLQHYLTMLGSTVAVPLFLSSKGFFNITDQLEIAVLIATMFFVSGICTFAQVTWGNRLPIVQGGTFSFLGPTAAICAMVTVEDAGWQVRMVHVQGAIIAGACAEILIGVTGLAGRMLKFIGPVTIAPTITLIGVSLFGAGSFFAGQDWWLAGLTIVLIVLFSQYLRHKARAFRMYPILLAIGVAWGVAIICTEMGIFNADGSDPRAVNWDNVTNSDWFGVPRPFQWGTPTFGFAAAVGMFAGFVASMIESIGDYYACARLAGAKAPDAKQVNRGITFEGIGCLIAGIFGTGNGTTSYSENIGAIGLTKVAARRVVQAGAIMMIVLGLFPKFGAIFTTIPQPVVGGMFCALFGMIAAVGLSNLQFVDLNSARNLFIIGFALYMGLVVPDYINKAHPNGFNASETWDWLAQMAYAICKSGMSVGAILAFVLDNTVPGTDEERGIIAWRQS